ncbi:MAG: hypothetical protein WEB06_10975 [Actinomycetota bacterium]
MPQGSGPPPRAAAIAAPFEDLREERGHDVASNVGELGNATFGAFPPGPVPCRTSEGAGGVLGENEGRDPARAEGRGRAARAHEDGKQRYPPLDPG